MPAVVDHPPSLVQAACDLGFGAGWIIDLIHLFKAITSVVMNLFGTETPSRLPVAANWATLIATSFLSIWLLRRKLRPHEVVK